MYMVWFELVLVYFSNVWQLYLFCNLVISLRIHLFFAEKETQTAPLIKECCTNTAVTILARCWACRLYTYIFNFVTEKV